MSSKFDKYVTDPVIKFVDADGVEQVYQYNPPQLDESGMERVSDTSLVSVADLSPMSLGERVRRYMRQPQFQEDLMNELGYDSLEDDELPDTLEGDDDAPMSPHEDRAYEHRARVKKAAEEKVEADKKAKTEAEIEAERKAMEDFRKRMKQLREEGSAPDDPR